MFANLGGLFSSMVVSVLVKSMCKRSIGAVDTIGCRGTLGSCPYAASNVCRTAAPGWSFLATRSIPTTNIGYSHTLDDLHLSGTIQSGNTVCLGDHKEQEIFSFTFGH